MENKLAFSRTFWNALVAGVTTGMGNGSVFGAAMMCALGRGPFESWGGWGIDAYNPVTFQGFITWCMLLFGFAFMAIVMLATRRHGEIEAQAASQQTAS